MFAPVFDAHIHIQPWHMMHAKVRERMWHGRAAPESVLELARDPGKLLRFLDEQRIETAVLVNYVSPEVMGFSEDTNAWIAGYVRGHEDRLVAMGSVHPRLTTDAGEDVERLADSGIRALKLHPPHQLVTANAYVTDGLEAQAQLYAAAAQRGLTLLVHTGTSIFPGARNRFADPMPVDDVACDFPDLRIVLAHGGRPLYMDTCMFLVRRHPNVWMDISGVPPKRLLHYFPRLDTVADKVLWGTDWPAPGVPSPLQNVQEFLALPLGDAAKQRILHANAPQVYGRPA